MTISGSTFISVRSLSWGHHCRFMEFLLILYSAHSFLWELEQTDVNVELPEPAMKPIQMTSQPLLCSQAELQAE